MLALLLLVVLYGGWRAAAAAIEALRRLPRSNEDMVFY
jgi:hypothetical protein